LEPSCSIRTDGDMIQTHEVKSRFSQFCESTWLMELHQTTIHFELQTPRRKCLGADRLSWAFINLDKLGAFAKLRKVSISFVMYVCTSVCRSVRPPGTNRLHWRIFVRFDIRVFWDNLWRYSSFIKVWQEQRVATLHKYLCTFISCRILLRTTNVLAKSFIENQITHFMLNTFFRQSFRFVR
jgi:hypothetical protein